MKLEEFISYEQPTNYIVHSDQYTEDGRTPVLTAGQSFILGYTDEEDGIYDGEPVVIFDDFTTSVQYVDFPFKVKSSAMKILKNKANANIKFCYYLLSWFQEMPPNHKRQWISTTSQIDIKLPSLTEQEAIVKKIEAVSNIIKHRNEELSELDNLIKARFVELFYDKGYSVLKWNDVFNTTTGKLDSNAAVEDGEYPFFTCSKEALRIDKYAFDQEALLLAGNNAAGKYDVKYYKGKFNAYQRTYVLGLKEDWSYQLFRYQLEDKLVYLQQQSLGGLTKYLTMKILGELDFIIPPMEKQIEFEEFAKQVDKSKVVVQKALDKAQLLFDSLMQEYFG